MCILFNVSQHLLVFNCVIVGLVNAWFWVDVCVRSTLRIRSASLMGFVILGKFDVLFKLYCVI